MKTEWWINWHAHNRKRRTLVKSLLLFEGKLESSKSLVVGEWQRPCVSSCLHCIETVARAPPLPTERKETRFQNGNPLAVEMSGRSRRHAAGSASSPKATSRLS